MSTSDNLEDLEITIEEFISATGSIPVFVENAGGGYSLVDTSLNNLYKTNTSVSRAIQLLNQKASSFVTKDSSSSNLASYYYDNEGSVLYCLYAPKGLGSNEFVLVIFSMIKTESLLSIISAYYGYIVLISIIIAVLIALFISRAFSIPIKTIEKEMQKLAKDDYTTSSYVFKNKELVSLQDTLNLVKDETKEKVENISSQKEMLENLNNELLKQEELRSSFIARLSHELKTPLMVISATTEAIMDGVIPEEDKQKEYNTIMEEVDKTTGIIKDIINTYRTSNKEMKLKITRFNLSTLVEETLNSLYPISQKNNLEVIVNLNNQVYMNADRDLIGQVISNFITNAFKYTESGKRVEIAIQDNGASFIFEVKNYGAHINDDNLQKIWLPFFRENENVDKSSTGMGLYIVKEILNAHKLIYDVTNFDEGVKSYFIIPK